MNLSALQFLVGFLISTNINAYDVLFVPMHFTGSHKKSMEPLAMYLAAQGHNITIWNTFFESSPIEDDTLVTDIDIVIETDNELYLQQYVWKNGSTIDSWNAPDINPLSMMMLWWLNTDICKHAVDQREADINHIGSKKWDLIIIDLFFAPCGYVIAEKAKASYVLLSTTFILIASSRHIGSPIPIDGGLPISVEFDHTKFLHRLWYTTVWQLGDSIIQKVISQIMRWNLYPDLSSAFTYESFDANSDFIISVYPQLIENPRPGLLTSIEGGDLDCKPRKQLSSEYLEFVNDPASEGTILVTSGHIVSWSSTKNETIYVMYEAFKQLTRYRVIWQYDGPPLPPLRNVKVSGWAPQVDILYDSRTVAFISHMGLKSSMEAICANVPFIALPIYAEQPMNTRLLIGRLRTGTYLNKWNFTTDEIIRQVDTVVTDDSYKQRIKNLQILIEDKHISYKEYMAHWIAFSIRHHQHLGIIKHRGRSIGFFKRWMVDVVGAALISALTLAVSVIYVSYSVAMRWL